MPNTATTDYLAESTRLDRITEARAEIQYWERQQRIRRTKQGRAHAAQRLASWRSALCDLKAPRTPSAV